MKKFLSLALALVMTMSLVTISVSAATFTDDSDIVYKEAVEVLNAIEVVGGYANGSFDPDATLTRGAAAKIICNLMLGPTVAAALGTNTDPFPDVAADHTFAGYIAYCVNEGIISGYADGTFRPSGTITGFAFMKMLLGALGYDASIEGYTATNWAVNVSADAKVSGLDDGNEDYNGSVAITREEACLYALNTLEAGIVSYTSKGTNIETPDWSITTGASDASISTTAFRTISFSKLIPDYTAVDAFDRPSTKWTFKGNSVGTFVDYENMIASYEGKVTNATMYSLIGDDSDDVVIEYVDGKLESGAAPAYVKNSSAAANDTGNSSLTEVYEYVSTITGDSTFYVVTINTYLVQAADDYNADKETLDIDVIATNTTDYASVSTAKISIDDVDVADFEEDDYILVTAAEDSAGNFVVKTAVLAELVTGEVTAYTTDKNVTLDGTQYSYNTVASATTKGTSYAVGESATLVLDQYGNVIHVDEAIVGSDRYVFIDKFAPDSNVLASSTTYLAAAYFPDGTYEEITINKALGYGISGVASDYATSGNLENKNTSPDTITDDTWYAYTTTSDGEYNLIQVESKYLASGANNTQSTSFTQDGTDTSANDKTVIESGKAAFSADLSTTLRANSATVFVIDDGDDVIAYTGVSNVPDITLKSVDGSAQGWSADVMTVYGLVNDETGYAAYVFVDASAAAIDGVANSVSDYVFVLNLDSVKYTSDDPIYTYNAIIDGEEVTFESKEDYSATSSNDVYKLYKELLTDGDYYKLPSDEIATNANTTTEKAGALSAAPKYSDGVLTFSTTVDFVITSDTTIWNIVTDSTLMDDDDNKYEVDTMSGDALAKFYKDCNTVGGYYYALLDGSTVEAIYVYATDTTYTAAVSTTAATANGVTLSSVATSPAAPDANMTVTVSGTATVAATFYLMNGTTVLDSDTVAINVAPNFSFDMPAENVVLSLTYTATPVVAP